MICILQKKNLYKIFLFLINKILPRTIIEIIEILIIITGYFVVWAIIHISFPDLRLYDVNEMLLKKKSSEKGEICSGDQGRMFPALLSPVGKTRNPRQSTFIPRILSDKWIPSVGWAEFKRFSMRLVISEETTMIMTDKSEMYDHRCTLWNFAINIWQTARRILFNSYDMCKEQLTCFINN